MVAIERTAYPRLKKQLSEVELRTHYHVNEQEQNLTRQNANGDSQRLTFIILLKTRQQLGYFQDLSSVSDQVKGYLAEKFDLSKETPILEEVNFKKTRFRYKNVIRAYLGTVTCKKSCLKKRIEPVILNAAYKMSDPADLINVAVEELAKENIELPAFSTLDRLVGHLRYLVHEKLYLQITCDLKTDEKAALESLLTVLPGEQFSGFNLLKQVPGTPTISHLRIWVNRLKRLDVILDPSPFLNGVAFTKIRQFASEAAAYAISEMHDIYNENRRLTLLLGYVHNTCVRHEVAKEGCFPYKEETISITR